MKKSIKLSGEDAEQFEAAFEAFELAKVNLNHQLKAVTDKYRARILTIFKRNGLNEIPDFNAKMTGPDGQPIRPLSVEWEDGTDEKDRLGTNGQKAVTEGTKQ